MYIHYTSTIFTMTIKSICISLCVHFNVSHCKYIFALFVYISLIYQIVSNTCSIFNVYLIIFSYHYMSSRFFVDIYANFFSAFVKCMHFIFNTCNNVQYNPLFAWCCSTIKMKYSNLI